MAQRVLTDDQPLKSAIATHWHDFHDSASLQETVAANIVALANRCIANHGFFAIVLAGGETPRAIYTQLCDANTDWQRWQVYFGDERCLPAGDAQRNDTMAMHALLQHVPIPVANIHRIPAEMAAEKAAQQYAQTLESVPQFDLVLLGLGEDGHTASLFPGHNLGTAADSPAVLAVHHAPKPPADRISMSARRLSAANAVWFIVSGDKKREALARWQAGDAIPAAAISPAAGVDVFASVGELTQLAN